MGNAITPCLKKDPKRNSYVNLIFWEGTTRILKGKKKHVAGEIMFEFPDKMVCHADSFFIGQPIPSLSIEDELIKGQTYFVFPIDTFNPILSASSLASLGSSPKRVPIDFGESPFEYIKGANGRVVIKVLPEFIIKLIVHRGNDQNSNNGEIIESSSSNSSSPINRIICSTPELQKQYDQLVRPKDQVWSPNLETISEYKIRYSPCRIIGLEWKQKEK